MKDRSPNPNLDYYHLPLAANQHIVVEQPDPDPAKDVSLHETERVKQREQSCRRAFSRIALSVVVMLVVWISLNTAIAIAAGIVYPSLLENVTFLLLISTLPLILVAIPVAYLVVRSMPAVTPEPTAPLGGAKFTLLIFIAMGIMIVGSIVSNIAMSIFSAILGAPLSNSLNMVLEAPIWVILLCTVILSPIFEEILCRKILLTRLLPYGEIPAILLSSLLFAFIHGNLFQFLYAFGVGALFAILYLRTGRLRYCMLLHIIVNALGSLVSVLIMSGMSEEMLSFINSGQMPEIAEDFYRMVFENIIPYMLMMLYSGLEYAMAVAGIILLIVFFKKFHATKKETDLPASRSLTLFLSSAGGILLLIVGVGFTLINMGII